MDESREAAPRPQPPALGRYPVRARLGAGGMGEVFLVYDSDLEREVAAKLLAAEDDRGRTEAFVREARITGQLEHPNIATIHEIGRAADGRPFFTMQRVAGQTLGAWLEAGRALVPRLEIFLKVCDALGYAHDKGILHRDLKPSNVMVGRFGQVYVMDWGLACSLDGQPLRSPAAPRALADLPRLSITEELALDGAGTVAGTPAYMSPEQARGERLDARSDIYGLGALLYHLLCGRAPYAGDSSAAIVAQVLRGTWTPPSAHGPVPWELESVVARAMARRREERYATVAALHADIVRFLEGRALRAARYGLGQRLGRWLRRHRARLVPAILLLALLAAGLVALQAERVRQESVARARSTADSAALAGDHRTVLDACARGLVLVPGDSLLSSLATLAQRALTAESLALASRLAEARAFERRQVALAPVLQAIDTTRPMFSIGHVAIEPWIARLADQLDSLAILTSAPAHGTAPELWETLGTGRALIGAWSEAERALRRALELDPARKRARFELARLLFERTLQEFFAPTISGEVHAAFQKQGLEALGSVLAAAPAPSDPLEAALLEGYRSFAAGDRDGAIASALAGTEDFEGRLGVEDFWLLLALAAEDPEVGLVAFDRALALRPHFALAAFGRGSLHATHGREAEALPDLERAVALGPELVIARANLAAALNGTGAPARGLEEYRHALTLAPERTWMWLGVANCLMELDKHAAAIDALDRFLEAHPDDLLGLLSRGLAWDHYGDLARAQRDYDRAIEVHGEKAAEALAARGLGLDSDVIAGKLARLNAILAADPDDFHALEERLHIHRRLGDEAAIARDLELMAAAEAHDAETFANRGRVRAFNLGDVAAGLADFERAVELAPERADAHYFLGAAHELLGQPRAAEESLMRAVSLDPLHDAAFERLADIRRIHLDDFVGAAEAYAQALALRPGHAGLLLGLGAASALAGDKARAEECFREAAVWEPTNPQAHMFLAELLLGEERYAEAREVLREARRHATGEELEEVGRMERRLRD